MRPYNVITHSTSRKHYYSFLCYYFIMLIDNVSHMATSYFMCRMMYELDGCFHINLLKGESLSVLTLNLSFRFVISQIS